MNYIKKATLFLLIVSLGVAIVFILLGTLLFAPIFKIFIYYLALYLMLRYIPLKAHKWFIYIAWLIFLFPILWGLVDIESLEDFLWAGVSLSMT